MKRLLTKAIEQGGYPQFWLDWDSMLLKHSDDPEVARLLQEFEANREAGRRALVAEGLIADAATGTGG